MTSFANWPIFHLTTAHELVYSYRQKLLKWLGGK